MDKARLISAFVEKASDPNLVVYSEQARQRLIDYGYNLRYGTLENAQRRYQRLLAFYETDEPLSVALIRDNSRQPRKPSVSFEQMKEALLDELSPLSYPLTLTITPAFVPNSRSFDLYLHDAEHARDIFDRITQDGDPAQYLGSAPRLATYTQPDENDRDALREALYNDNNLTFFYTVAPIAGANPTPGFHTVLCNLYYEVHLSSPPSTNNQCGLALLSQLLSIPIPSLIKAYNPSTPLLLSEFMHIYQAICTSPLTISTLEEFTPKNHTQVILHEKHYYLVESYAPIKPSVYQGMITFDYETHLDNGVHTPSVLCTYSPNPDLCKTFIGKTASRQFIDFLQALAEQKKYYRLIAHNGASFDFYHVLSALAPEESSKASFLLGGKRIMTMKIYNHVFIDSNLLVHCSLDKFCRDFKVESPKGKYIVNGREFSSSELWAYKHDLSYSAYMSLLDTEPEYFKALITYCYKDCQSLYLCMDKLYLELERARQLLEKECLTLYSPNPYKPVPSISLDVTTQITIGSLASSLYKQAMQIVNNDEFFEDLFQTKTDKKRFSLRPTPIEESLELFLREFIRGGESYSCQKAFQDDAVKDDVTSLYPYAGTLGSIPSGTPHFYYSPDTISKTYQPLTKWRQRSHTISKLTYRNQKGYFSPGYYAITKLTFPKGTPRHKFIATKSEDGTLNWLTDDIITERLYLSDSVLNELHYHYTITSVEVEHALIFPRKIPASRFGFFFTALYKIKMAEDEKALNKDPSYNPTLRAVSKMLMNSMSGKCVENRLNRVNTSFCFEINPNSPFSVGGKPIESNTNKRLQPLLRIGLAIYDESKNYNRRLFRGIEDEIRQVETDSFIIPSHLQHVVKANMVKYNLPGYASNPPQLGQLTREGVITSKTPQLYLGKKTSLIDLVKNGETEMCANCKGIPAQTTLPNGTKATLITRELYTRLAQGYEAMVTFGTMEKVVENCLIYSGIMTRRISFKPILPFSTEGLRPIPTPTNPIIGTVFYLKDGQCYENE